MQLDKKIAVLTGASSGLGAAIATTLVKSGVVVFGLARNIVALKEIAEKLGENFHPVQMDITQYMAVGNWVKNTFSEHFSPDILINNAGVGAFRKIDEMPAEEWLTMINTNLNGMYYVSASIIPFLKKKKTGTHIINIGSIMGITTREEGSAYCASKFGVSGFSEALFKELRHDGIKVTCFNSGSIETEFLKTSGIESHSNMLHPDELAAFIVHILQTPDNMLINEITLRPLNPKKPI